MRVENMTGFREAMRSEMMDLEMMDLEMMGLVCTQYADYSMSQSPIIYFPFVALICTHPSHFTFGSESDVFNSVNIGCTAGFEMFWTTRGQPYYQSPLGAGQVCVCVCVCVH